MKASEIRSVEIEASNYCNLKCPLCSREDVLDPSQINSDHLERETLGKFLQELHATVEFTVSGVFGDPMSHPRIEDLCEDLISHGDGVVTLTTNGSLRDQKLYESLGRFSGKSNRLFIEFSIDGLEQSNEVYRQGSRFEKIRSNASAFLGTGGRGICKMIAFEHNEDEVESVRQFALEMGFEKFKLVHSTRFSASFEKSKSKVFPSKRVVHGDFLLKGDPLNLFESIDCQYLHRPSIYLSAQGLIFPCCYLAADSFVNRDWQEMLRQFSDSEFNSIKSRGLTDILNHDFFKSYVSDGWEQVLETSKTCYTHCTKPRLKQKQQLREMHGLKLDV